MELNKDQRGWLKQNSKYAYIKSLRKELKLKRVDQEIFPHVLELMKLKDIATTQSCSGHKREDGKPAISFIGLSCTPEKVDSMWRVLIKTYEEIYGDAESRASLRVQLINQFNGKAFLNYFMIYATTDKMNLCYKTLIRNLENEGFQREEKELGLDKPSEPSVFDKRKGV